MLQARLFDPADPPYWTTPEFYESRDAAPHLEQEGHRERLLLAADMVQQALDSGARRIVDLGAGDGGLLSLFPGVPSIGFDLQPSNVEAANARGVDVCLRDVIDDRPALTDLDVLVVTEVYEHLLRPFDYARDLARTDARSMVASSPYTETPESHYEFHSYCWDIDGYRDMLERAGWRVIRQETAWISQVCLCVKA